MTGASAKPKPGPEHEKLALLIGRWQTRGNTIVTASQPAIAFSGTDSYAWLEGGLFVLHQVDVMMGDRPVIGVETIWHDPSSGTYRSHFVDADGATSGYEARLEGRTWTMVSEIDRFSGSFSEDGKVLTGRWERRSGSSNWGPWMDVTLTRI
jgi:hypothetical protein